MSKLNPFYLSEAVKTHALLGDTDLFPRSPEVDAFSRLESDLIAFATSRDLSNLEIGPARRFVVPKDDFSLRVATQFDPFDSVALTSLVLEFGEGIEDQRPSRSDVFSYRFEPQSDGRLFDPAMDWTSFWEECERRAKGATFVGYVDITDFYNQIYHHTLENQLKTCGWPEYTTRYVHRLLGQLTSKVSRGMPVGPYATHLLAEATLIPIDNSFQAHGINYCRYVDDIVFFANSETSARSTLFQIAEILDKQQRLTTNRQKTRLYRHIEFKELNGNNPVRSIIDVSEEYAVGFLNSEGGSIFWGIRDADRIVVGVSLSSADRDRLNRDVTSKLSGIQPQIDPGRFKILYHSILGAGSEVTVVELRIPKANSGDPYYTPSHEAYSAIRC